MAVITVIIIHIIEVILGVEATEEVLTIILEVDFMAMLENLVVLIEAEVTPILVEKVVTIEVYQKIGVADSTSYTWQICYNRRHMRNYYCRNVCFKFKENTIKLGESDNINSIIRFFRWFQSLP